MNMVTKKVPSLFLLIVILMVGLLNSHNLSAQNSLSSTNSKRLPKHSIHITANTILRYNAIDLSYSRLFKTPRKQNRYIGFSLGVGAHYIFYPLNTGYLKDDSYYGYFVKSDFIALKGSNNNFFEFNVGFNVGKAFPNEGNSTIDYDIIIFPNVGLGYRGILFNEILIFRAGLSLVRGVYIGLGFNL